MMQKASQSLLCCWCGKIFASLFTVSNSLPQAQVSILLKLQVQKGKSTITGNNLKILAIFVQDLMHFFYMAMTLCKHKIPLILGGEMIHTDGVCCSLYRTPKVFLVTWLEVEFPFVTPPIKSVNNEDQYCA